MSTPQQRSARSRRRIAGERRTGRPGEPTDQTRVDETPVAVARADTATEPPSPVGDEPEPPRAARPGPSWTVVAALAALTLVLVAVAAVLGLLTWDVRVVREQARVDDASRAAPAAAERAVAAILAYDYRSLDADEHAAERYMTSSYRAKYADTFDRLVRPNAAKVRARVAAQVKASGVSHADPDRVNVLLYVNQTTTSTANGGEPQLALNRVQLSMVQRGGSWLVDNITSY